MCGFLPHHQAILRYHMSSYNSSQFWHYLPRDSIKFRRLRAQSYKRAHPFPHFTCQSQVQAIDHRFQRPLSLDMINLIERCMKYRQTVYLLFYWFITKIISNSIITWLVLWQQTLILRCFQKNHLININLGVVKRSLWILTYLHHSYLLRKLQGFQEPCVGNWNKKTPHKYIYIYLLINHNITDIKIKIPIIANQ